MSTYKNFVNKNYKKEKMVFVNVLTVEMHEEYTHTVVSNAQSPLNTKKKKKKLHK